MKTPKNPTVPHVPAHSDQPPRESAYEPPRIIEKRSVEHVTLASGGGSAAGGYRMGRR